MSNIPNDLRYAKSHEWVKLENDGTATVGITDYAQSSLGDITYVQAPKVGAAFKAGETFGVVESVKAASDLYLPVAGTIVAVNPQLDHAPENRQFRPVCRWLDAENQAGQSRGDREPVGRGGIRQSGWVTRRRRPQAMLSCTHRSGPGNATPSSRWSEADSCSHEAAKLTKG